MIAKVRGALPSLARRAAPYVPALVASGLVGRYFTGGILQLAREPAAPLDDTFIHFQYARRLAEGHFFSYVPGEGYSSGATSLLWPLVLAPFHALGLRGLSLLYAAWILGLFAHAALAVEVYRLARRLAGEGAAVGAGAMSALFGAFAWFAWSGMETIPLAWMLLRTARAAAAYCEPEARAQSGRPVRAAELVALGIATPLMRPEGAIASLIAAIAIGARGRGKERYLALAPLAGPLVVPLLNLALTGHAASSASTVKWMLGNPYYGAGIAGAASLANARFLVGHLLNGGEWTAIFLPDRANVPLLLGAIAMPLAAYRRRLPFHAVFVAMVALGVLVPCTYLSFLWNRSRYIWPFVGAHFVLVACFAREAGDLVRRARPRLAFVPALISGLCAGALATRLPWAAHDLAQSAAAIQGQQVTLARWVAANLPPEARVGVNDTGAIAYLGGRRTFDVVGLTTEGEARYWAAGAGSRFEHYEKLPPGRRPTHFIVYPQWMLCPPVMGRELTSATVMDQSILGGPTMVAYEARWDALGSGARPREEPDGLELVDEIDVADLESERAHGYAIDDANEQTDVAALFGADPAEGREGAVADGGRLYRRADRFEVRVPAGARARLVMRVAADEPLELQVSAGGAPSGEVRVATPFGGFVEAAVELPAAAGDRPVPIEVRPRDGSAALPRFHAFHYWVYAAR